MIIYYIIVTVVPFFLRTLMNRALGSAYLGLNSLFLSLCSVINISDLGIGTIVVFFLYEQAAYNRKDKIIAYLNYLKRFYHIIGNIIALTGICITPFLKLFIDKDIPSNCNVYLLFILYFLTFVLQNFINPEIVSLFAAFQKNDIMNWIDLVSIIIGYVLQIISLIVWRSYLLYVLSLFIQLTIMWGGRLLARKKFFPSYRGIETLDIHEKKLIRKKIIVMFGHQIDERLLNTIDTIFISSFIGLTAVAVYGNYFFVIVGVSMLTKTVINSALSSLGNAVVVESTLSNLFRYKCIFQLNAIVSGWATACMLCLYNDFMKWWMGEAPLSIYMVILFCIYYYFANMRQNTIVFKNAAGLWANDKAKPYVAIIVDLLLDLILIKQIGISGAIISSIICVTIIELPWESKVLFKDYFHIKYKEYLIPLVKYTIVNLMIIICSFIIYNRINTNESVLKLFIGFIICSVVSVVIFYLTYHNTDEFKAWKYEIADLISKKPCSSDKK